MSGREVVEVAPVRDERSWRARVGSVALGAWGAVTGVAPHVLHHVGPLAGAAFLAGAGGRILFAAIALATSIPLLIRIHRRFRTWLAPAIALTVMAAMFSLSSFVVGPLITGESDETPTPLEEEHEEHGHQPKSKR